MRRVAVVVASLSLCVGVAGIASPANAAATHVTATPADSRLHVDRALAVSGAVKPATARTVRLQRLTTGGWKTIASGSSRSNGRYRLEVKANSSAVWTLRTIAPATRRHAAARSTPFTVEVVRSTTVTAQLASASVPLGQSAGISGIVKPIAAGRLVSIQQRTESGWAPVTTTHSDSNGRFLAFVSPATVGTTALRARVAQTATRTFATSGVRTLTTTGALAGDAIVTLDAQRKVRVRELGGDKRSYNLPVVPALAETGRLIWTTEGGRSGRDRLHVAGDGRASREVAVAPRTGCLAGSAISDDGTTVAWGVGTKTASGQSCRGLSRAFVMSLDAPAPTPVQLLATFGSAIGAQLNFAAGTTHLQLVGAGPSGVVANMLAGPDGAALTASGLTDLGRWYVADVRAPAGAVVVADGDGRIARLTIGASSAPDILATGVTSAAGNDSGTQVVYVTAGDKIRLAAGDFSEPVDVGVSGVGAEPFVGWVGDERIVVTNFGAATTPIAQIRSATFALESTIPEFVFGVMDE